MHTDTKYRSVRAVLRSRSSDYFFSRWQMIVLLAVVFGMSLAVADAGTKKKLFSIEAQPARHSLTLYARQAQVQLGFSAGVTDDVVTNAVIGEYDASQALKLLLEGTGLQAEHGERGIIIRRAPESQTVGSVGEPEEAIAETTSLQLVQAFRPALAQVATQSGAGSGSGVATEVDIEVEEIVVTGSQIRGAGAAGANVITFDSEYIELTGLATTQEIIQTLPQNFGEGANEANQAVGVGGGTGNLGWSSSINLRGLGTDSTLLLLNGRRSAPGGSAGSFVDLNSIATAAIERIEVLPDGASAVYGSDAIGGVVNVILRSNYDGAETRLRSAPGTSDIEESQVSQVFGKSWNSGSVLVTYEYYDRSELKSADRVYTRDSDLTNLGGSNRSVPGSNPSNIVRYVLVDGTSQSVQLAIPSDQDGSALTPADLIDGMTNLQNIREGTDVIPKQERHSVFVAAGQNLSETVELFAEARYSTREFESRSGFSLFNQITVPSSNAFFVDPFGGSQSLTLEYYFTDDYGPRRQTGDVDTLSAVLGATFDLGSAWQLEAYGAYSTEDTFNRNDRFANSTLLAAALADSDPNTAFNPFGDGSFTNPATLAAIEAFVEANLEAELAVFNVRTDGELFDLPGGAAKLAIGMQLRDESLLSFSNRFTFTTEPVLSENFDLDRDITAAFAEVYLPFVTEQNSRPGIKNLAISLAGRYEDYSDFGNTFDPKFGITWSPAVGLTFRSTIGTSFRAPLLTELDDQNRSIFLIDASSATGSPPNTDLTLFILGNSPELVPQEGTTWTAGFDIEPNSLPGFGISLTYFETDVDNLIGFPAVSLFDPFRDPVTFAPILTRCPCDAEAASLMSEPVFFSGPVQPSEVDAIVDFRIQNAAKVQMSGLDVNLDYELETDFGSFSASLYASHLFEFNEQVAAGPLVDNVDKVGKPNSLKLRGSLFLGFGGWHAAATVNHIGDYVNTLTVPESRVSSWTTWDMRIGYDFDNENSEILSGTRMSLNIQNVFDKDPPFVDGSAAGVGFDSINANPMGQFASIQLTKEW